MEPIFRDRKQAGKALAQRVAESVTAGNILVLGLPRGGVPVASGGVQVLNESLVRELQLSPSLITRIAQREQIELERREQLYREGRPRIPVQHRNIILVDDGLATGASMKAAAKALRTEHPARIIVAVPVAARQTCDEFRAEVDEIICLHTPAPFLGVGMWYEDFSQTTDAEVQCCLEQAARSRHP